MAPIAEIYGTLVSGVVERDPFQELSEAAERNPDDPRSWLRLARAFIDNGVTPIAKHLIERAVSCARTDAWVWMELGMLAQSCADDATALSAFRRAAELAPGTGESHAGLVLLRMNRSQEAEIVLRDALERDPNAEDIVSALARALVDQGRFSEARQVLDRAPVEDAAQLALLATIARNTGDREGAVRALRRVRQLSPGDARAALDLAKALLEQGDAAGARRELQDLSSTADVHLEAGRLSMSADAPQVAMMHLAKVAEANPRSAEIQGELARACEAAERWPETIDAYQKSIELRGDEAGSLFGLGRALAFVGRFRDATPVLVRAAALAPEDEDIRAALTRVLMERPPSTLDGDLHQFRIPELLEFLAHQHSTGILEVTSPHGRAEVRMLEGKLLSASWKDGETLVDGLVSLGLAERSSFDSDDNAVVVRKASEHKMVPRDVLRTLLASQIVDGLVEMIGLSDGRASFRKTAAPPFPLDPELLVDPRYALLEASRRIDELNARTRS